MKKRLLSYFALAALISANAYSLPMSLLKVPELSANSFVLIDANTWTTLSSKDENVVMNPADLNKLMLVYIAFDALQSGKIKLQQMVTPPAEAFQVDGARMYLDPEKKVKVEDLLKGIIVNSANDAALSLVYALAANELVFTAQMNEQAKRLGMSNTKFANSTGIKNAGNMTTLHDLAILSRNLLQKYPQYRSYFTIKEFTYNNVSQPSKNLLLYREPSVNGLMVAQSGQNNFLQIAHSTRDGRNMLALSNGSKNEEQRAVDSSKLINYGFQNFETPKLYTKGDIIKKNVVVYKGLYPNVDILMGNDVYITFAKGERDHLKAQLEFFKPLIAPLNKKDKVGVLKISLKGVVLKETPVYLAKDVPLGDFFDRIIDSLKLFFGY